MFKSVFAKYITAATVIVLISFCILASVITSIIANYSTEEKMESVEDIADLAADIVEQGYQSDIYPDLEDFFNERPDVEYAVIRLTHNKKDVSLFIAQPNGKVLFASDEFIENADKITANQSFWEDVQKSIAGAGFYSETLIVEELGPEKQIVFAENILDQYGRIIGIAFSCSSNLATDQLVNTTAQTVIMSCLWVMLAMLIAIYFLTERLVDPLKRMSVISKNYAKGKFDTRIEVGGHDEVAELATAFNNMASELDSLEQKRNQFISDVSHELRSPMMSILGFVEGVRDGTVPKDKESYYLDLTVVEIKRLSRLVADLLDVSRIEMGEKKLNFTKCNLCERARLVLISLEARIEAKKLAVEFYAQEDSMYVRADEDALHRVLYNLIENAIKFSHEGGALKVSIKENKSKELVLAVYNEGVGVSKEDLPNIFDRFYKSDKSRSQDKKGVGLGLYFVKTIVVAHGGDIKADSEEGKYCVFTVKLPKYQDK